MIKFYKQDCYQDKYKHRIKLTITMKKEKNVKKNTFTNLTSTDSVVQLSEASETSLYSL